MSEGKTPFSLSDLKNQILLSPFIVFKITSGFESIIFLTMSSNELLPKV